MPRRRPIAIALLSMLAAGLGIAALARGRAPPALRIATWNMEWLVAPATARAARLACRDRRRAALPCDVARQLARDSADLARLAREVRRLDADVIAFQEVEDAAIARRVFRGYRICIARGPGLQHVGYAVRPGIAHRCGPQVASVAGGGRGRDGLLLELQAEGLPAIELLAVHLKSGCANAALDGPDNACRLLAAQAHALGQWIAGRAARGTPFIVLGDFNRTGTPASGDPFWQMLGPTGFRAAASTLPFVNCVLGQPYAAYIDHILVGEALAARLGPEPFGRLRPAPADAARYQLSDHCPVSVMLQRTRTAN
jgi:endonuclease/exonuclease/phosphatase family metal-dependent hydrolase